MNGEVWIYDPSTTDCYLIYNNRPSLPSSLQDSTFQTVSLPNKSSFGTIEPVATQERFEVMFGEGLYLKNQLNNNDCSNIDDNGSYQNVLGTFPNGDQAYYAGHAELDENTLENPLVDGGAAMMKLNNITGYDEWNEVPQCPIPLKSFVNSEYLYYVIRIILFVISNILHPSHQCFKYHSRYMLFICLECRCTMHILLDRKRRQQPRSSLWISR